MVGWYNPSQLARTGVKTVVSALFGERADFRAMEALSQRPVEHDCAAGQGDAWVDYVSDTGDGFAATYAVASLLGRPAVEVAVEGATRALPRGRVLIMGGDEVYPTPSPEAYAQRLVGPYASALPFEEGAADAERPALFAVPGNHDWYDGLGAFMGLFAAGKTVGNWRTPQERSYFVLRLPHRVWLFGVDLQLSHDVDRGQLEAMLDIVRARAIGHGDRVILCTPEPDWAYRASELEAHVPAQLDALREALHARGAAVVLQLAGDLHHYRRQSDAGNRRHLVTAGGGGAFVHPTHTSPPGPYDTLGGTYTDQKSFPSAKQSKRLSWGNWRFLAHNGWFGATTAAVYVILGLVMPPAEMPPGPWYAFVPLLALDGLARVRENVASMTWMIFVIAGFFAFTDTRVRWYRYVAGLTHGLAHLGAALVGGVLAHAVSDAAYVSVTGLFGDKSWIHDRVAKIASLVAYVLSLGAWGYVIGAALFGAYLLGSVRLFGRHGNEAFSALRCEGYKHFLRMRIAPDAIEVFVVGLDAVPRAKSYAWRDGRWRLSDAKALAPHLVDRFEARA
jgi:hypothetical protein